MIYGKGKTEMKGERKIVSLLEQQTVEPICGSKKTRKKRRTASLLLYGRGMARAERAAGDSRKKIQDKRRKKRECVLL